MSIKTKPMETLLKQVLPIILLCASLSGFAQPTDPATVTATAATICQGASVTLNYTGRSGTTFAWYSSSCGGTPEGTGDNLVVSPTVTTTYYGRWEVGTTYSNCLSVTVTVNPLPVAPSSVSATQPSICLGNSTNLTYSGGSGTTFAWYSSSCGGTLVGTGNNLSISPSVTTTYYGRWETSCGNSTCQPITIVVNPLPTSPSSVTATATTICAGETTYLSYSGGSGTTFNWYAGSCGGSSIGSGNNIAVSPASTTTYYGRWENTCGNSGCAIVTVYVNAMPVAPSSVNATLTTICEGASSVLSYSGGSGSNFVWYTGSCGGTMVGSGNNITVYPTTTTTYYGRWESGCGSSGCQSVTITVNPLPVAPASVTATLTTVCSGQSVTLSYTGGSGTTFNWYTGGCGVSLAGSGNNLTVTPSGTTTYYGLWQNGCGQSACASVTITVIDYPTAPSSINATATTICSGEYVTLSHTGGSGSEFNWYSGSCGGTFVGSGETWLVAPTVTTTYYGRYTSSCGNSACASITITVHYFPVPPSSVQASQSTICIGESTILSYTGGSGDVFNWYTGTCNGTLVGTGNNLVVSPTTTTTYYGQWANDCGTGMCLSVTVYVDQYPVAPSSVNASQTTICNSESITLSYAGGSGTEFHWYSGSCNGTFVGIGNNFPVYPSTTTTYYGQWVTPCGVSACQSVTVTVNDFPSPPTDVNASQTSICVGQSVTLTYTGGSGDTFNWYSGSCNGALVGHGQNLVVSPTTTTTYYGQWQSSCGAGICESVTVTVNNYPTAPSSVSATQTTLCNGESTTLYYSGGSGTEFRWYSGSCGGTLVGIGNNISLYPSATTTYYGQWVTPCGNSACVSVTVTVNNFPVPPTAVYASQNSICVGESVTLTYAGGSGDIFNWYSGACNGALVGHDNNLVVSPTTTTTYYGQWQNDCGAGICEYVTVYVSSPPTDPISVSASRTDICQGESVTLRYTGGSGDTFWWYSGACGGSVVGTGNSVSVTPVATTTYYGQWETDCGLTECLSVTVTVQPYVYAPNSVNASNIYICEGESVILTYSGGSGTTFNWYSGYCRGTLVGSGNSLEVSPTQTTTYYGSWENSCYHSDCEYVTVYVQSYPEPPTDVTSVNASICQGESTMLRYTGGSGNTFYWFTGACGGQTVGTGNYLTVYPSVTTTYYGLWETDCGRSVCDTVTVEVIPYTEAPTDVTATRASICKGESTDLLFSGGSGETFVWYQNNCRGTRVGEGNSFRVYPTETTTYYGAWENDCYQSDCEWVTITVNTNCVPSGISLTEMEGLMIYPNPASDQIRIQSPDRTYDDIEVSLIDMSGKVIHQENYDHFGAGIEYSIAIDALPPSIYYLKIGNAKLVHYEKIVKQ